MSGSGRPFRIANGAALLILCAAAGAQGQGAVAGGALPADWSLTDPAGIRFGRVSLVHDPARPHLDVYTLRSAPPSTPVAGTRTALPAFAGDVLRVADFADGDRNRLGGFANAFQRAPSTGTAAPALSSDDRPALRIDCRNEPGGYCGAWVHLFDSTAPLPARRYLDVRPLAALTFRIRGERGGERILLKVADAEWERREDALPIGTVEEFLAAGRIGTDWQLATVPLSALPARVDPAALASLVFEATGPGDTRVWITSLAFSRSASGAAPLPDAVVGAAPVRRLHRATWVWHTAQLIADPAARDSLIAFLERDGFDVVFLQLPDSSGGSRLPGEIVPDGAGLGPIVGALHAAGMQVYALDGYKGYVLPAYQEGVLRTIDHVARYDAASPPLQRFDGFRHDIEPHVLPGFDGPRKESLLLRYLEITELSAARANAAGLRYGVDIPFWYDAPDADTQEPVLVTFRGERRPVSEHVIAIADDIAIMDYRTSAWGADGTLRHAEGELAYAARLGRPVFIGLETAPLPDETILEFAGAPAPEPAGLDAPRGAIVIGPSTADSIRMAFLPAVSLDGDVATILRAAGIDPARALWWPVRRATDVSADRITFARKGEAELRRVSEDTLRGLGAAPALAGIAIHEARAWRALGRR